MVIVKVEYRPIMGIEVAELACTGGFAHNNVMRRRAKVTSGHTSLFRPLGTNYLLEHIG